MYINEKILVGKGENHEAYLLPKMANRHGLITGASGSGKTVTLKVLAESFSSAGVPVFLVDVKGDLAGMPFIDENNENVSGRVEKLGLEGWEYKKFPTAFFDVNGEKGHPIRTTVSSIGARLLSRMLDLSDVQEEVLGVVFKISNDENLELIDLGDLDDMLSYVDEKKKEYSQTYGNISGQTITSIKRAVINLREAGGDLFFGKPAFDIKDFMNWGESGYGYINILDAQTLFKTPTTYVIMLLWLLNTLYNEMPEVGDLDKPKLVFFFDEAHLIFSEMKENVVKQLIQIVKLIRSKGIGLYFISQSPSDINDEVLSQLGNRVQHVLRAYTKTDEKSIKAAADGFRTNPKFDTVEAIKELGTGEALVSFQTEHGEPSVVEKVKILPPQSRMGTITDSEREQVIKAGRLYGKYDTLIDDHSASEKIKAKREEIAKIEEEKAAAIQAEKEEKAAAIQAEKERKEEEKAKREAERAEEKARREAEKAKKNDPLYKIGKKAENKAVNKLLDKGLNKLFKKFFK
ncbi:MAG: DUF853 family protein [Bacilli bacterium]|nr:DUF853 family protein [Bacilli bacterium]